MKPLPADWNDQNAARCRCCGTHLATRRTDLRLDGEMVIEHLALVPGMSFDDPRGVYRISNRARARLDAGKPAQRLRPDHFPKPCFVPGQNAYVLVPTNDRFILELRGVPVQIECPRCQTVSGVTL